MPTVVVILKGCGGLKFGKWIAIPSRSGMPDIFASRAETRSFNDGAK
jgi:hypothetical protein